MYNGYEVEGGKHLKLWNSHGEFEEQAMDQLRNVAKLPFIHKHVAGMPDVHYGKGATVGSVIATKGAIVPAAVGVDIGCGMVAVKTNITAERLPDNLHALRCDIEAAVPHGFSKGKDKGSWEETPYLVETKFIETLYEGFRKLGERTPRFKNTNPVKQLGTLGGGNHFIEVCLDEEGIVWVMLHSGSRGVGNKIGTYFISKAKEEMERYYIDRHLPDQDLAYLVEHTTNFNDYIKSLHWAQQYAALNRQVMLENVMVVLKNYFPEIQGQQEAINCHHNYAQIENHFGDNVWITRKGAVRARQGDLGIIPGSMGTGSFIVRGLGNEDSFCSCSHGAGRVMSRSKAKKVIKLEDHAKAMQGIEARLDEDVLDESPAAYKDIGAVMEAQSDLVEIVARLRQVINIKG